MLTAAQFRKLALAFPEVEEKSHFEQPDFRVRNKIFAGLSQDHEQGTLKLTPELQAMVLSAEPDVFIPAAGAWGRSGWTRIVLAKAELPGLRELLAESYRLVAPKTLASKIDPDHALQDAAPEAEPRPRKRAAKKRARKGMSRKAAPAAEPASKPRKGTPRKAAPASKPRKGVSRKAEPASKPRKGTSRKAAPRKRATKKRPPRKAASRS